MIHHPQDDAPCHICGGTSYSWGTAQAGENLSFKGEDAGFLAKVTIFGGEPIRARKCESCGNVQLFVRE